MKLKGILAPLALVSLALLPVGAPQEQPPAPLWADAVVTDVADVKWVPPALPREYLEGAAFRIYGYEGNEATLLETTDGLAVHASVRGGYSTYAVALVVDGVESVHVKVVVCFSVSDSPPFLSSRC